MPAIDVIVVPDFAGPAARLFEARTLLFLGSWLEHPGASRDWPLRLACIGQPPASVRDLAERCQAEVTTFNSLALPESGLMNKLRGLELPSRTGRTLLVDVDTLILNDLAPFLELGECIGLAPANQNQLSLEMWEEIYRELGVPMPAERVLCLRARLQGRLPARYFQRNENEAMVPYFNSGVLLAPAQVQLREPWWQFCERLLALARERGGRWKTVRLNDQVGLAVALAQLSRQGVLIRELPPACHGNYLLFWAGALTLQTVLIFHAMKLYRLGEPGQPLDARREIEAYDAYLRKGAYPDTLLGRGQRLLKWGGGPADESIPGQVDKLCRRIRELHQRYVAPVLD